MSLQVEVIKKAYLQGEIEFEDAKEEDDDIDEEEHDAASPRNVGHNIYILAHQVGLHEYSQLMACMLIMHVFPMSKLVCPRFSWRVTIKSCP